MHSIEPFPTNQPKIPWIRGVLLGLILSNILISARLINDYAQKLSYSLGPSFSGSSHAKCSVQHITAYIAPWPSKVSRLGAAGSLLLLKLKWLRLVLRELSCSSCCGAWTAKCPDSWGAPPVLDRRSCSLQDFPEYFGCNRRLQEMKHSGSLKGQTKAAGGVRA